MMTLNDARARRPKAVSFDVASALAAMAMVLTQALGAQAVPAASDSIPTSFRERPSAMATPRFAGLWTVPAPQFHRAWDSAHVADRNALEAVRAQITAEAMERELMRL